MPKDIAALNHVIDDLMVDLGSTVEDTPASTQFRCSGLPMCPIRRLFFDKGQESFHKDFYVKVGTAIHDAIQNWMSKGKRANNIVAEWSCLDCGTLRSPGFKPIQCEDCGSTKGFKYNEITIRYRNLSGHVDLLYHLGNNRFLLIDFKTTDLSAKRNKGGWEKTFKPSPNYYVQIRSYATLLKEVFGYNIVAWALLFIDRAKPIRESRDYHKIVKPWKQHNHDMYLKLINQSCRNAKRLEEFNAIMATSNSYNAKAVDLLKEIVVKRPCKSEEQYDRWMSHAFYSGECEMLDACCTSSKAVYKRIKQML